MTKARGLRLRLFRRADPVLTEEELEFVEARMSSYIDTAEQQMSRGLVSESVIRGKMEAESVRGKVRDVLMSIRPERHWV